MQREHLEERPHFVPVGQASKCRQMAFARRAVEIARKRLGARLDPEPQQERALRNKLRMGGRRRRAGQRLEIDMRGQVSLARRLQRMGRGMFPDRLERIAKGPPVAIIHDQRGAALGVDYSRTVSCYQADDQGRGCGLCDACRLRAQGFREAGLPDPTRYQPGTV